MFRMWVRVSFFSFLIKYLVSVLYTYVVFTYTHTHTHTHTHDEPNLTYKLKYILYLEGPVQILPSLVE